MNNLKQIIYSTVRKVVEEESIEVGEIHEDDALVDNLGLRSMDLARILAILELKLNVNPFAELVSITSIRTVGDLCAAYAKCFAEDQSSENQSSEDQAPKQQPRRRLGRQRDLRRAARNNLS